MATVYKRWRVAPATGSSIDFRGQPAAYQWVTALTGAGIAVTVYHWQDGSWVLYERIESDAEADR